MKKQLPSSRSTSTPVHHQFDHELPTIVHDPEQNMTALERALYHVIKDPRKYLSPAIWIVASVVAVIAVWSMVSRSRTASSDVWAKLEIAKKADERVAIAKAHPNSEASTWALLLAASETYGDALKDLPNNRDVALPAFQKAIGLFDQVVATAPNDSPQAREAALGKARALEARNELAKAIEQYELVAKSWPGTSEADQAKQLANILKSPEAANFYKELYSYSRSKVTLPPLGSESVPFAPGGATTLPFSPLLPPGDTSSLLNMPIESAPTPIREVKAETIKSAAPVKPPEGSSPANAPSKPAPSPAESIKVEVIKPTLPNLPTDVFSPKPRD